MSDGEAGAAALPRLHVLVTDAVAARPGFRSRAAGLREACGSRLALHLRLREASGRAIFDLARTLLGDAGRHGGWVVVNGRLDVALAAGAHAVQLGREALPLSRAREVASGRLRIGASVHGPDEASAAAGDGADFVVLGTIFATPSHPGIEPSGPAAVAACRDVGIPILAIGGVRADRVPELLAAGAHGVAVVRAVWEAEDPRDAAAGLLAALERGSRDGHG